ncbi:hypothetical protein HPB49_003636 [Dermacentor silvarum]|uniref:Uncharacterized protein n=1 Tax=Dermacentor silvarum TaxID=543639 RepID=A0ACB8CPH1_DERSI|nr:hypothetical protein HPB49_003636 [Dermacentor silvarum]
MHICASAESNVDELLWLFPVVLVYHISIRCSLRFVDCDYACLNYGEMLTFSRNPCLLVNGDGCYTMLYRNTVMVNFDSNLCCSVYEWFCFEPSNVTGSGYIRLEPQA